MKKTIIIIAIIIAILAMALSAILLIKATNLSDTTITTTTTTTTTKNNPPDNNPTDEDPIILTLEEFVALWSDSDSYQMDITLLDWSEGGFTVTEKWDGNLFYQSPFVWPVESYVEIVEGKKYLYQTDANDLTKWTKSELEEGKQYSLISDEIFAAFSNADNFEKVEGEENTYKIKSDVTIPLCNDILITLGDGICTITLNAYFYIGYSDIMVVISNIGNVELTLPTVGE